MKLFSSISIATVLGSLLFTAAASKANPQVEPSIHKLCIEAKDYAGCVRAMKGDTSNTTRQIRSQGADIAEGNQCPSGFAYVGGGNCMEVKCVYNTATGLGFDTGHDQRVAGKANWGGKGSFCMELESCNFKAPQEQASILTVLLANLKSATTALVKNLLLDGRALQNKLLEKDVKRQSAISGSVNTNAAIRLTWMPTQR